VSNDKGFTITKDNRESAALIFTFSGKISFTNKSGQVISDPNTAVYISQGASYINRCLEDAESIMFGFYCDEWDDKIISFSAIDKKEIADIYDRICSESAFDSPKNNASVLSLVYSIFCKLLDTERKSTMLSPALEVIASHFDSPDLSLDMLAKKCNISKPYLHKLFIKEFSLSPYQDSGLTGYGLWPISSEIRVPQMQHSNKDSSSSVQDLVSSI
jgi:AraC-like DNA-binding protein